MPISIVIFDVQFQEIQEILRENLENVQFQEKVVISASWNLLE